jgi:hypothetical protein
MISLFKITRKKDPCVKQGKVSLWVPSGFEIHETSRLWEVENSKGSHSETFPIRKAWHFFYALFSPFYFWAAPEP